MSIEVGQRVCVKSSVVVYVHPLHQNQPFDTVGSEGEVVELLDNWQGRHISPTLPIVVQFQLDERKQFRAHFKDFELEAIDG
ncbi:MAG: ferredoxin-thioredoxin reductase variable chain [Geitlerinemataceae cyanobacterium]